ncbi:MAG: hypothetical protein ACUVTE_07535 [Candidatus Bathycorpusculaceae bacterium]
MGTIRSEYSIEQFERAFQRFAHEEVPKLIPKFHKIRVADFDTNIDIEFFYDLKGNIEKIAVYYHHRDDLDTWGESFAFTIEPKDYVDSPHITKIHYNGANDKAHNEKILAWLKSILGSETPKTRFHLKEFSRKVNRKLTDYKAFSRG